MSHFSFSVWGFSLRFFHPFGCFIHVGRAGLGLIFIAMIAFSPLASGERELRLEVTDRNHVARAAVSATAARACNNGPPLWWDPGGKSGVSARCWARLGVHNLDTNDNTTFSNISLSLCHSVSQVDQIGCGVCFTEDNVVCSVHTYNRERNDVTVDSHSFWRPYVPVCHF